MAELSQVVLPGEIPQVIPPEPQRDQFATEHLVADLGKRAITGGAVTALAQVARFGLNLLSAVVLARLLSPSEFGLVAMVLAVTSLLALFKEAGLSTATVQREVITQQQVSNLFWINVALGTVMTVISMILAVPVSWFYRDPRLVGIMLALSLTFVLSGAAVQQQALLTRNMRFGVLASIDVCAMTVGLAIGCWMAWSGYSYWALVCMQLSTTLCTLIFTWKASRWMPSRPSRKSNVMSMLSFGAYLTFSDLIARLARSSDSVLVGRFFGAGPLGIYSRASVLLARPMEQLLAPINAVLVPVLSRLQSDPVRYRQTFLRAADLMALVTFPMCALFMALCHPLVVLLLGHGWEEAIPLFAGFALAALSLPLAFAAIWLFTSQGRGKDQLHAYLIMAVATVLAFAAGLPWGPLGVVLAFAIYGILVRLPVLFYLAGRSGPVSTLDLWRTFLYYVPCWAGVYVSADIVYDLLPYHSAAVQVLAAAPVGLIVGAIIILSIRRSRESSIYALKKLHSSILSRRSKEA